MDSNNLKVLEQWAKYSKYDRKQTSFNMNSYEYELNRVNKKIEMLLHQYDENGILSIMIAKNMFYTMISKLQIPFESYLQSSDNLFEELKEDREMYATFNSKEVIDSENAYFFNISKLIQKVAGHKLIGDANDENLKNMIINSTETVINDLEKCRLDVYKKGGIVENITNFSTQIYVFPSIAKCLLALEKVKDGMYLTYIDFNKSPDSFFGFFIKSNGNLFSISERIPEVYKDSHSNSRNGRWTDEKADKLFPYQYIFKYENYDYKGYSTVYELKEDNLEFLHLGEKIYIPLLLGMLFVSKKYSGKILDKDVVYLDTLMPQNITLLSSDKNELAVINNTALVESHKHINFDFDSKKILNREYDDEFLYGKGMSSNNTNQLFVDLYGDGFEIDMNKILTISPNTLIENSTKESLIEFLGTEHQHRLQAFYLIREQLAEYIRENMKKEYIQFGKIQAYKEWFYDAIKTNLNKIEDIIAKRYEEYLKGQNFTMDGWSTTNQEIKTDIYYETNVNYPSTSYGYYIVNQKNKREIYDARTGAKCTIFFKLNPKDYTALEDLFGDIPKLIKGWSLNGHSRTGNWILDVTDAVEAIGTPFEYYEYSRYQEEGLGYSYFNFCFIIGYSKRGFNKMLKEHQK